MEKVNQAEDLHKRKVGKKQQWGPVLPLRRSSRNLDDGNTMMDKAQEMKRKWDLGNNEGNKKSYKPISSDHLLSVAKDIGVVIQDGNAGVVSAMLELDSNRSKDCDLHCKHPECCPSSDTGLDIEESLDKVDQSVDSTVQPTRTGDAVEILEDQEKGWSKVGRRKKNKKNKK
jgi:hypothetical protein